MPNKSDPNSTQPANQSGVPSIFPQSDLPPLPDFSSPGAPTPAGQSASTVTPTTQPLTQAPGSAAPTDLPPVISTNPKKKFGGGKLIATILGILVLIGGVGAGIVLIQQRQLFQQKAFIPEGTTGGYLGDQPEGEKPVHRIDEGVDGGGGAGAEGGTCGTGGTCNSGLVCDSSNVCKPTSLVTACRSGNTAACTSLCGGQPSEIQNTCVPAGVGCTTMGGYACTNWHWTNCIGGGTNGVGCGTGTTSNNETTEGSPSPSPTPGAPQCLNVKAYSSTWTLLTSTELSALAPDTIVNFCVTGSALTGTFDKAQFKINLTTKPETTTKGQGGAATSFCQSYTILSTDTTVNVKAKIHHATLNQWVGETF